MPPTGHEREKQEEEEQVTKQMVADGVRCYMDGWVEEGGGGWVQEEKGIMGILKG